MYTVTYQNTLRWYHCDDIEIQGLFRLDFLAWNSWECSHFSKSSSRYHCTENKSPEPTFFSYFFFKSQQNYQRLKYQQKQIKALGTLSARWSLEAKFIMGNYRNLLVLSDWWKQYCKLTPVFPFLCMCAMLQYKYK